MITDNKSKKLLIAGIIGCLLYFTGDLLYAAIGKNQSTESFGLMVRVAHLEISTWRMVASILCGFIATFLYYVGYHRMYKLLRIHVQDERDQIWVKIFRVAYITGTVSWAYLHAMFMNIALIFKFIYQKYGNISEAAEIANKVFYANAAPLLIAVVVCDGFLALSTMAMVWKGIIPLKSTWSKILASLCNPTMSTVVIGNLVALLPWPLNQLDPASESAGHALVLALGLVLLKEMKRRGEVR